MEELRVLPEILGFYKKFGWRLESVLLTPSAFSCVDEEIHRLVGDVPLTEAEVSAAWFTRASNGDREAWELRLLSADQFAIFETFPNDLPLEELDDARSEMEVRLIEYVTAKPRPKLPTATPPKPQTNSHSRSFYKKK